MFYSAAVIAFRELDSGQVTESLNVRLARCDCFFKVLQSTIRILLVIHCIPARSEKFFTRSTCLHGTIEGDDRLRIVLVLKLAKSGLCVHLLISCTKRDGSRKMFHRFGAIT